MMTKKIEVGDVVAGYEIKDICHERVLAERVKKVDCDDYVVWHLDFDKCGVCGGKYFSSKSDASDYFYDYVRDYVCEEMGLPF